MKVPKSIELTEEQLDALLVRVKNSALQPGDYEIIKAALDTVLFLEQAYEEKTFSIKRLLRMLFGARTEKTKNVVGTDDGDKKASGNNGCDGTKEQPAENTADCFNKDDACDSKAGSCNEDAPKKRRKGHGRNGADAYSGADKNVVAYLGLKSGDPCPLCPKGRVYKMKMPGVVVRIVGKPPLDAKVYELEKLRCNLCGEVFTASLPEQAGSEKYDETAKAMIGVLKYGFGFPFYRLEKLQDCFQWDKVEEGADLIYPAFEQLKRQAAQGSVIHNDDTIMKVLELMNNDDSQEDEDQAESLRKGMFTTGILSVTEGKKIALFFTGHKHAGENFADLLNKRQTDRSPPIQMCDALSRNSSEYAEVILAHCNVHARRKFVDVAENFPQECRYVLEVFEEIYKNDDISKKANMSPDQRLEFHKERSGPIMEEFLSWLNEQFDDKKVEPNSGLGKAISYVLNHWNELTRFLQVPGAPLDNNIVEQALKRVILHRKNSLFYKTLHGAYVGDMYMSLIHTCILAGKNPFDYITELQKHSSEVFKNPSQWMPWNYESTIAAMTSDPCLNTEGAIAIEV
jgi:hypothetical protein